MTASHALSQTDCQSKAKMSSFSAKQPCRQEKPPPRTLVGGQPRRGGGRGRKLPENQKHNFLKYLLFPLGRVLLLGHGQALLGRRQPRLGEHQLRLGFGQADTEALDGLAALFDLRVGPLEVGLSDGKRSPLPIAWGNYRPSASWAIHFASPHLRAWCSKLSLKQHFAPASPSRGSIAA